MKPVAIVDGPEVVSDRITGVVIFAVKRSVESCGAFLKFYLTYFNIVGNKGQSKPR
jgi:hypothetical protein